MLSTKITWLNRELIISPKVDVIGLNASSSRRLYYEYKTFLDWNSIDYTEYPAFGNEEWG